MDSKPFRISNFVLMIMIGLIVFGCVPKVAPVYKDKVGLKPEQLTPFVNKEAGIEFGLPAGWEKMPLPKAADEGLRLQFSKKAVEGVMQIYCQGAFVSRVGLAIQPLLVVTGLDEKSVRLWEERSMGGGLFDPEFSAWTGHTMVGYDLVEMNYYIAYKMPSGFNCKYGLVLYGPKKYAPELERDFLGIVSTLK